MIGKAKIFIYALFKPNKHVPPVKFPVKWHHKCVLVLVRRCKNFKDCPKELSYYDWNHATKHGLVYWDRLKTCLILAGSLWVALHIRRHFDVQRKIDIEARSAKRLPKIPGYELGFSTDQFHHTYNSMLPESQE